MILTVVFDLAKHCNVQPSEALNMPRDMFLAMHDELRKRMEKNG